MIFAVIILALSTLIFGIYIIHLHTRLSEAIVDKNNAETLTATWDALGLPRGATLPIRDVLARRDLPPAAGLAADVAAHGVAVFVVG
jgi:hypothetical protein